MIHSNCSNIFLQKYFAIHMICKNHIRTLNLSKFYINYKGLTARFTYLSISISKNPLNNYLTIINFLPFS